MNPVVQMFQIGLHDVDQIREVLTIRDREGDEAAKKRFRELTGWTDV